jgi:lambda family phage portal protein
MSWFNRYVIAALSPQWALKREMAQRGLNAYYEAAEPSRLHKWRTDRRSANVQNDRALWPLLTQARHLEENFDLASGVLDVLVNNIIGSQIQPEPQVLLLSGEPAQEVNKKLLRLYSDWIHVCDVTRQNDLYSWYRLFGRSGFRDGEVFGQRIIGNVPCLEHGTVVPYSLEALECDFVPKDYNDLGRGIRQGIECNAWGKPRAYHVYKTHPGDWSGGVAGIGIPTPTAIKRVPADVMMHFALRKRFHQLRGISVFANVLNRFDDIKEIDDNERVAARIASAMAAYVKKGQPEMYDAPDRDSDGNAKRREMFFEPGLLFDDLQPGEEVGTIDTKRPNNALIPFRDSQMRSAAAGTMTGFSSISKNYNGTYSAQRQELVEQFVCYRQLTGMFVYRTCQPVWDGFIDAVTISGAVEIGRNVDRTTLYDCTHTNPPVPWINPVDEVNAKILQMKWGFKSRTRIIREFGDNPDEMNREIQRDQHERQRLGIQLIGDGETPQPTHAPPGPPPPKTGDDPEARRRRTLNRAIQ